MKVKIFQVTTIEFIAKSIVNRWKNLDIREFDMFNDILPSG